MINAIKIVEIFCKCDDFVKIIMPYVQKHMLGSSHRKSGQLSMSEIMTIEILYHLSGFKCFEYYYRSMVEHELKTYFPNAVSYERFVTLKPRMLFFLTLFMHYQCMGKHTGWYYIDSSKIAVCHNRRIHSHKVFKDMAARGKTSVDWFYGFKLHLVINNMGQIVSFRITRGNVADNDTKLVDSMCEELKGQIFGDKGYINQKLLDMLMLHHLELITKLKKNMKPRLISLSNKAKLEKRGVIESVIDILKTVSDLEHTRHRSPVNAMVNIIASLVAYSFMDRKPTASMALDENRYYLDRLAA